VQTSRHFFARVNQMVVIADYYGAMRIRLQKRARDVGADPANHYARLADDMGHARKAYRATDDGKPLSGAMLLMQPLSLFLMSLMALVLLCAIQLWRQGMFPPLFANKGAVVDGAPKNWILNGRARRVEDDRLVRSPAKPLTQVAAPAEDDEEDTPSE
jgi:hypothetical protein